TTLFRSGVIFAQQMARGIDNFVLLAIPFFILVGYLMEANGMSVRLIELLERLVGRLRGGLNVVMVLSMVIFSGISGSKMADVAAVGSVLIPAARRSRQNPGGAVALLAASAVMAETIPPCINLIILGFVAGLSIGGLFMAGLLPAAAMRSFVHAATRSGLVLFIVAAAQSLAFVLTLQQVPHALADMMIGLSQASGTWLFMLLSIAILIVMGSVLEGAAALIIFGPLLVPVAAQLGIAPLHYGVVLVISMGVGLFAPPLGLGLYGSCLIGNVPIEVTVKPMMKYLGLLFLCLLVITFVPAITLWLPHALGY